jgi:cell division transport system permease protein
MNAVPRLPKLQLDLPLERDGSARFLPAIVALMVYLAALALAGMMALDGALSRWDRALAGTLTLQLPPGDAASGTAALAAIRTVPGVEQAELLGDDATLKLLEPWLGNVVDIRELQLPRLVDLHVDAAARADPAALRARLLAAMPGARLDDNRIWLDPLLSAVAAVEYVALAIVLLVGIAAVLSIIFATRTGLSIHQGAVEVLHLIGARDSYIARQFQWHALRLGLRGAAIGLLGAGVTLLILARAAGSATPIAGAARALPVLELTGLAWTALFLLVPAAGLVALVTARITVLRTLGRMP